jgi:hypothetical protein
MVINGRRVSAMARTAAGIACRTALVSVCLGVVCACTAAERTISRPTIAAGTGWHMEHCAGQYCPRAEDVLVTSDLRVRIETSAGRTSGRFRIMVNFFTQSDEFAFDPSAVTVTLSGGTTLYATGVSCAQKRSDSSGGSSAAPSTGPIRKRQILCYHLVFDSRTPAVTEEFVMRLYGITRNGATVHVPDIVFRPHVVTPLLGDFFD